MPLYDYTCPDGHTTTRLVRFDERDEAWTCGCGQPTEREFPMPHVPPDGVYSYCPNIGDANVHERRNEAIRARDNP